MCHRAAQKRVKDLKGNRTPRDRFHHYIQMVRVSATHKAGHDPTKCVRLTKQSQLGSENEPGGST